MKICPTCESPVPDEVTPSHHQRGCACGVCRGGGDDSGHCVWTKLTPECLTSSPAQIAMAGAMFHEYATAFRLRYPPGTGAIVTEDE